MTQVVRCTGQTKAGNPCKSPAIHGGTVCWKHGGAAPQVRAKSEIRYELSQWVMGDAVDDPAETLLRLITQSRRRADAYAAELTMRSEPYETLQEALVGDSYITGMDGSVHKAGEYIRGLVVLEAQERDRCANFCIKAIAAGIAERQVKLAEQQGALIAEVIRAMIADPEFGLTVEQQEMGKRIASRHLRLVSAS